VEYLFLPDQMQLNIHGLHGEINAPQLKAVVTNGHNFVVAPGTEFTGRAEGTGTVFSMSNPSNWDGSPGNVEMSFTNDRPTITIKNADFRMHSMKLNDAAKMPGASLLGNATYVAVGPPNDNPWNRGQIIVAGDDFIIGSKDSAPQFITDDHTVWNGNHGTFYGIMAAGTSQFNEQVGYTLTFTGMLLRNIYASGDTTINENANAYGQGATQSLSQTNNRVVSSGQNLDPGAVNMNTALMKTVADNAVGEDSENDNNNNGNGTPVWSIPSQPLPGKGANQFALQNN
jgi:hypothetical protein